MENQVCYPATVGSQAVKTVDVYSASLFHYKEVPRIPKYFLTVHIEAISFSQLTATTASTAVTKTAKPVIVPGVEAPACLQVHYR